MKATVFYDSKGEIQSVVFVHPEAKTNPKGVRNYPKSADHASLEIELDSVSPDKLAEVHSRHYVDTVNGTLIRR